MTMVTLTDLYINDHCINLGITRDKLNCCSVFPDGVTKIGDSFPRCTSLTSITIPDGVTGLVEGLSLDVPLRSIH